MEHLPPEPPVRSHFWIPSGAKDIENHIGRPDLADDARFFFDRYCVLWFQGKILELPGGHMAARISQKFLTRVMQQRYYSAVIEDLREAGYVSGYIPYAPGKRSTGYVLPASVVNTQFIRHKITSNRVKRAMKRLRDSTYATQVFRWKPIHTALNEMQQDITVNTRELNRLIKGIQESRNPFGISRIASRVVRAETKHMTIGEFGRVFNCMTSLNRELRPALRYEGERLVGVDIGAAQLLMLVKLITSESSRLDQSPKLITGTSENIRESSYMFGVFDSPDFQHFAASCYYSVVYDLLLEAIQEASGSYVSRLDRATVKRHVLRDVIAQKSNYKSEVRDAFQLLFPSVLRFIDNYNRDDHRSLIRELQRQESDFVIHTVCPRLVDMGIWHVTIHDSVWTAPRWAEQVREVFAECFREIGIEGTLKIEDSYGRTLQMG